jgi:hypothetical protein
LSIHLNNYEHNHLLEVVTRLQEFYSLPHSPNVSAKAVIGIYKALLHALKVFIVDEGGKQYMRPMLNVGNSAEDDVVKLIETRIATLKEDEETEEYSADWALRCLLVVMRDAPLTPYGTERSIVNKIVDKAKGKPTSYERKEYEETLLEPIGRNLTEVVIAYISAQSHSR